MTVPRQSRSPLRVGFIGCGWAARTLHADSLRRSGVGILAAASDLHRKAAESIGAEHVFPDWRDLLRSGICDAVLIASPPAEHAAAAIAAIEAGCAVLLEKPVATSLGDARRIADAARRTNQQVAVGFNQRCHPDLIRARQEIARGTWGKLERIAVRWSSGAGLGARAWLAERALGGGALFDLGSHTVDLWRFLAGAELTSLHAESTSVLLDDQQVTLRAELSCGATATAELSLVGIDDFHIEIVSSAKRVTIRPYGRKFSQSYVEQWHSFDRAVRGAGHPAASLEDGLASLHWVTDASRALPVRAKDASPPIQFPMSAISSTTLGYSAIRTTVAHLRRQSVASKIELVLVGPTIESLDASPEELEGFADVTRVAVGPVKSIAHANAAGVRRARGNVVALTEDHCFPEPEWAEALLCAHEENWSVVGPVVINGNPATIVSDADFVIGYGPWMAPMGPEEMPFLPGHNSCYRRDELLALGGRLERLMESETVLHMEWASQGKRMRVAPGARTRHMNYSLWTSWIPVQVLAGRLFGGMRAAVWSRRKQLFYAAASPLIPAVRLWRIVSEFTRPGRSMVRLLQMSPALIFGLILDGVGQCAGYLWGPGDAMERLARYEFNRVEHVRPQERALWISR